MTASLLANVEMAPKDPILGVTETFNADTNPKKVNLGVGVYLDDNGKVPVLQAVRTAEQKLAATAMPRNYLPIDGLAVYNKAVQQVVFGADSEAVTSGRIVTAQTPGWDDMSFDAQVDNVCKQGRPPFGVQLRVIDDAGAVLPRDGATSGQLQIRGPWVIKRYFKAEADATDDEQWFDTGDIAVIHPDGTLQLTDRAKDVIKSGGEWISSVELENAAVGCPGVAEAGAIGVYHPKWDERPVLVVVKKPGAELSEDDVKAYLSDKIAKWWMPDKIIFADDLPHTGTGKILKTELRARYKDMSLTE